jgi:hypothetical protein
MSSGNTSRSVKKFGLHGMPENPVSCSVSGNVIISITAYAFLFILLLLLLFLLLLLSVIFVCCVPPIAVALVVVWPIHVTVKV